MINISLSNILKHHQNNYGSIIAKGFLTQPPFVFDFTKNNSQLSGVDITNIKVFTDYINSSLRASGKKFGAGGYGENRVLYFSPLFAKGDEPRSVHLGVDLWLTEGTEIFAPISGKVHSFQNNKSLLDYGPTIILEHNLGGVHFYTLYGHLSKDSLENLTVGKTFKKGDVVARLGNSAENGQWPPHLHFQVIADMLGKVGDFPGVAKFSEKDYYLELCPNPNLILQISSLI